MSRLDWEKARERDQAREAKTAEALPTSAGRWHSARHRALATFVEEHELRCFRCGAEKAEWAKTGISKRGAWAICVPCASKPR